MSVSFLSYAATSTALLAFVCYQAHEQRRQFYPTVRRVASSPRYPSACVAREWPG